MEGDQVSPSVTQSRDEVHTEIQKVYAAHEGLDRAIQTDLGDAVIRYWLLQLVTHAERAAQKIGVQRG
jgi:hypothetical protein